MPKQPPTILFKDSSIHDIIDYVYEYGSFSFLDKPFNDIDNLIFSVVCYFPFERFEKIDDEFKEKTLQEICIDYLSWIRIDYINEHYPDWMKRSLCLAMALLNTKRYSQTKVLELTAIFSMEERCQFASMACRINDDSLIISFRGTDCSILGWEENFDMLYLDEIPGQNYARTFLKHVLKKNPRLPFRTMGHSKGGNIAIGSCLGLADKYLDRLVSIYSNDGPGFRKDVFLSEEYLKIKERIKLLVIEYDLIGMIYNNPQPYKIIYSTPKGDGLLGHDPYMWRIEKDHFICVDSLYGDAIAFQIAFNQWVEQKNFGSEERKLFIKTLTKILDESKFEDVNVVMKDPLTAIFKALKVAQKMTNIEKRSIWNSAVSLFTLLSRAKQKVKADLKKATTPMKEISEKEIEKTTKAIENTKDFDIVS